MEKLTICVFFALYLSYGNSESTSPQQNIPGITRYGECDSSALYLRPPCCGNIEQTRNRIMNGKYVEINKYPWMVYVLPVKCGGSLINNRFVLSAAHCFQHPGYICYQVQLGAAQANGYSPYAKTIPVEQIFNHEYYNYDYVLNDIALLKLRYRVEFSASIKPICLPYKAAGPFDFVNKNAVVAGWGTVENGYLSPFLKEATVLVWDQCHPLKSTFDNNHICAGGIYGTGTCYGDSGGPLFLELPQTDRSKSYWIQIGIVSFGLDRVCANGLPSAFSNVTTQMQWIERTMWRNQ